MTSQSSTNKINTVSLWSLMREDLRRKTWMIALSILGSFLAGPVAFLFYFSDGMNGRINQYIQIVGDAVYSREGDFLMTLQEYYKTLLEQATGYLNSYYFILMLVIAFVGAMIVAFFGFRFLYHKRMVDLYHSAPVSRRKLFTAFWLNGVLIWLMPALATSLLVFVFASIFTKGNYVATLLVTVLHMLLRLCLCYLIVYHVCLVGVMLSGNVINAIVNGLAIGLLVLGCVVAVIALSETFYANYYLPSELFFENPLYGLSPLVTPILLTYYWMREGGAVTALLVWHLVCGIIVMLGNLVLAYLLYLRRPSELSERGLENKWVRILLRSSICVVGGIGFAMIFQIAAGFGRFGWILFGMFFGSALSFCILNVIYHCTFKEVFSHKINYAIVLGICLVLFFGAMFDVTGYGKRLPKKENITGISLCVPKYMDNDANALLSKDGLLYDIHGSGPNPAYTSRDQESIYNLLSACVKNDGLSWNSYTNVTVKVYTKFGSYYRSYKLPDEDYALLAPFVESREYAEVNYPVKSLKLGMPTSVTLVSSFGRDDQINDPSRIEALMNAMHQDFEDHRTQKDLLRDSRVFALRMSFPREGGNRINYSYNIPYWYERTVSLVKGWYPDRQWDPYIEDIEQFVLSSEITVLEGQSPHAALLKLYGYDENGMPLTDLTALPAKYRISNSESTYTYADWAFKASSTDFLKDIEPCLIWGLYENPLENDYVFLGTAYLKEGGTARCYIQASKLPLSVLAEIETKLRDPYQADVFPEEYTEDYDLYYDYYGDVYYE